MIILIHENLQTHSIIGGRNHEEIFPSAPGGYVRRVHGAGALLHHHRVHVQRRPLGLPQEGAGRRGQAHV